LNVLTVREKEERLLIPILPVKFAKDWEQLRSRVLLRPVPTAMEKGRSQESISLVLPAEEKEY
jgi:hypothetical protein